MRWARPAAGQVWVLVATLAAVALTSALGLWQLERAAQKQAFARDVAAQAQLPAVRDWPVLANGQALAAPQLWHRRADLRGHWLPAHTVYLDNRQMNGRPGFFVLTPLQLTDSQQVLLVQRGWVPRHFQDRQALAPVDTPSGEVRVQGRLADWPSKIYEFAPSDGALVRQNLDFAAHLRQTGLRLPPLSVLQTDADSEGLRRAWPEVATGVAKHHGYAAQWFGLAALLVLLYVWFQIVKPRTTHARTQPHPR